jgi:hypothetical protein
MKRSELKKQIEDTIVELLNEKVQDDLAGAGVQNADKTAVTAITTANKSKQPVTVTGPKGSVMVAPGSK